MFCPEAGLFGPEAGLYSCWAPWSETPAEDQLQDEPASGPFARLYLGQGMGGVFLPEGSLRVNHRKLESRCKVPSHGVEVF